MDQMKMSREHALLGNYDASLVYFDGVVAQIQQYLRTADDPYLRSQWQKAKEDLVAEFRIVKEITQELGRFKESPGAGAAREPASVGAGAGGWDDEAGYADYRAPVESSVDDPDVWPPPTSQPEPRRPAGRRCSSGPGDAAGWGRPPVAPQPRCNIRALSFVVRDHSLEARSEDRPVVRIAVQGRLNAARAERPHNR